MQIALAYRGAPGWWGSYRSYDTLVVYGSLYYMRERIRMITCRVESCDKRVIGRGYCMSHYHRLRRTGNLSADKLIGELRTRGICKSVGCERLHQAGGYCGTHYKRFIQYGDAFDNIPIGELRKRGICKVASCDRQHFSRGYCSTHYRRFRIHGNPRADIAIRAYVRRPAHDKAGIVK